MQNTLRSPCSTSADRASQKNGDIRDSLDRVVVWLHLAIGFKNLAATAQSPTATFKGIVIYPSEMLPAQKVCAENVRTKQSSCVETKQGQ